ncbi:LysM peptidoglycan-binding domain-containing M23 family metallopeptidase [Rickettsia endosymbiont of Polydrusus tereticollis]|uniref:murein hydrolase activator EnvC family protein n=1 Tax=Rickettsia endosymbiont of Polydrusus tereticollis TaxID=3066251 RepID=UPI003132F424
MLLFFAVIFVVACVDQPAAPIEYGGGANASHTLINTNKSPNRLEQDEGVIVRKNIDESDVQEKSAGILKEEQESLEESDDVITVPTRDDSKIIYHEVQEGETLESIAKDYEQNLKALANFNDLTYPYILDESQIIKIKVSNELLNKKNIRQVNTDFIKPVDGKIITNFGEETPYGKSKGINIAAAEGSSVKSVAAGKVVYSGYDKQFGNLLIVKLDSSNLYAAYAHLKEAIPKKGASVIKGEVIGYVGHTGNAKTAQLHFAIRKGKIAVDPAEYVPLN